jgi:hypothetical protein
MGTELFKFLKIYFRMVYRFFDKTGLVTVFSLAMLEVANMALTHFAEWIKRFPLFIGFAIEIGIALGIASIVIGIFTLIKRIRAHYTKGMATQPSPSEKLYKDVLFFPSRKELPKIQSEFNKTNAIWALWFSGNVANAKAVFENKSIKRLVLISPKSDMARLYSHSCQRPLAELEEGVLRTKQKAESKGIKLRLFNGYIPFNMTVFNPHHDTAKIRIEIPVPYGHSDDRPSIIIDKTEYPELYKNLIQSYERIWKESKGKGEDKNGR